MALPFVATYTLDMQEKTAYAAFLSMLYTLAMMAFYIQFPLVSRLKRIALFANINWSMSLHKKIGLWLGIIFLMHPVLIVAPRFMVSFDDGMVSLMTTLKAPQMLTGIIAWVGLIVWVLLAVFRDRLKLRYEVWRFIHMLGFVVIAILATMHITTVGSHGQFASWFNWLWWGLCALSVGIVLYNYIERLSIVRANPFELIEVKPVSSRDWQLTIEKPADSDFDFEPGQFVWINTSASGGVKDHPFSIASAKSSLPQVSFVIRSLGDYTSKLNELTVGQKVYVDGPYGSISLEDARRSKAVVLIAGGAGIGPLLSLLRGLAERKDPRPVRLIYGNKRLDQMVLQDEISMLEKHMPDFKQQLVCKESDERDDVYQGVIDQTIVTQVMSSQAIEDWAVYLCGPEPMVDAVKKTLKKIRVPGNNVHFEQLSF
jgi:predicted ferric reductase